MEHEQTTIVIVGISNVMTIGFLVFKIGGLFTKITSLVNEVAKLTKDVTLLKLKVVRLESLLYERRRRHPEDEDTELELSP